MARNVTVVEGMRGPQNARENQAADGPQQHSDTPKIKGKPSEKIFSSRYSKLRIQVTAPADRVDPSTGRVIMARPKAAQFVQGIYRTSDKDTVEYLMAHPGYGLGKSFWLAEAAVKAGEEKHYKDMLAAVKANPALADRLLGDLSGDEFPVSKPEPAASGAPAS